MTYISISAVGMVPCCNIPNTALLPCTCCQLMNGTLLKKFLIWNQHSMPQHLLLRPLYNQHVQTLPPHYSSTFYSNQVGLLLKQITTVCPVKLFILWEILSQPPFSIYCFTPTVQDHPVQHPYMLLWHNKKLCYVPSQCYLGFHLFIVSTMVMKTEWDMDIWNYQHFINFFCTLLLNLLNSLYLSTRFTHIFRFPQHNSGGGEMQQGYHRK